jgi:hypothetical protein
MVLGQAVFLFAFVVAGTAVEALVERQRDRHVVRVPCAGTGGVQGRAL